MPEEMSEGAFQLGVAKVVVHFDQALGKDLLAGLGQLLRTLPTEQQLWSEAGHGKHGRPVQHASERPGVLEIADRGGSHRVDRARQRMVEQRPLVDVDEIVDADPRQPLAA